MGAERLRTLTFGSGSMAGIAISLFIKNPNSTQRGLIEYYDIGDDLTREEKLSKITQFGSIAGIADWQDIIPDWHGDWLKQRDDNFNQFISMGDKDGKESQVIFANYSRGVITGRDAWCCNSSNSIIAANMNRMIAFYNSEVARFSQTEPKPKVDEFINPDASKISWTVNLKQALTKIRNFVFEYKCLIPSLYRPFTKQWLYFNRDFNERVLQMPRIFPNETVRNRVIMVKGHWSGIGQLALMTDIVAGDQPDGGAQCFPLYLYETTPPPCPLPLTGEGENIFPPISSTFSGQGDGSDGVNSLSPLSCQGDGGQGGGVNSLYRVEKIRYGKIGPNKDPATLIYNNHITLTGIPIEAYAYIINGKPALDWVIERQGIKTDKPSGIVNDANAYAIETMHNPKYPLELIQRIITVSLETLRIVATL